MNNFSKILNIVSILVLLIATIIDIDPQYFNLGLQMILTMIVANQVTIINKLNNSDKKKGGKYVE